MTSPVYFTVEADFKAFIEDASSDSDYDPQVVPISATVTFTPLINAGDVVLATNASPRPTGFIPAPITAIIDSADGRLKMRTGTDVGATGFSFAPVRLLGSSALLELDGPLEYSCRFSEVVFSNGRRGTIAGFNFEAPNSDTVLNLIEVARVPGQVQSGITKIAPGGVRLEDGDIIFSFASVDIPESIPFTPLFTSTEMTDSTVTGRAVITAVDAAAARTAIGAENSAMKGASGGYASLDGDTKVPYAQLPTGATGGTVAAGDDSRIVGAEQAANKGASGGYAPLDSSGLIDAAYLPSYVDDVLSYANEAAFPVTGETGKIYVALDNNDAFRWTGSAYLRISDRVTAAGITDSTSVGRAVVTASTELAARTALGAERAAVVNVKDYGAVGDWNTGSQTGTDDSAAFAAALTAAGGSKKVYVPAGNYRLASELQLTALGAWLEGDYGGTNLYIDHAGIGVRIATREITVMNLRVLCSTARAGAAFSSSSIAVLAEGIGTPETHTRTRLDHVDVMGHPGHGFVFTNSAYHSIYSRLLAQSNKGHGFVIDGGEITGTDASSPGLCTLQHCWAIENSGHGLVLGNPSATSTPLRIRVDNLECTGNATDAAVRFTRDEAWVFGDNCEIRQSAFGPEGIATTAATGDGSTATVTLNANPYCVIGDTITVAGVTPSGYNGTHTVTAASASAPWTVSYASTQTGSQTVAGTCVNMSRYGLLVSGRNWIIANNRFINLGRSVTFSGTTLNANAPTGSRLETMRVIPAQPVAVVIESGVTNTHVYLPSITNMTVPVQDNAAVTAGNVIRTFPPHSSATLSATNNDYSWDLGRQSLRLTAAGGGSSITGLARPSTGRQVRLFNVGSDAITLSHQSSSSTAANRLISPTGADFVMVAGSSVMVEYDGTTSRWRIVVPNPTTDTVPEGATNKYYTDARADARITNAIGTSVQAYDADLTALAGLTSAADKLPYFTGSGTANVTTLTSAGRALLDDADASAQRTTLSLNNVDNTSDLNKPISTATQTALDGKAASSHTQAASTISDFSTAADARITNAIGSTVQAYDADLTAFAGKTAPTGVVVGDADTQALSNKDLTAGTNTFPTFNQNTTGSAATLTTGRRIDGTSFNGSADIRTLSANTFSPLAYTSGQYYYCNSATAAIAANTLGNGTVRVSRWDVEKAITISRLWAEVTVVGDASCTFRIGIWNDDGTGKPGTLLLDAGTIAGDSATVQEITVSQALGPGTYWVGGAVQGVTTTQPTIRSVSAAALNHHLPLGTSLPGSNVQAVGFTHTGQTGAFGTFTTSPGISANVPRIGFKVS